MGICRKKSRRGTDFSEAIFDKALRVWKLEVWGQRVKSLVVGGK